LDVLEHRNIRNVQLEMQYFFTRSFFYIKIGSIKPVKNKSPNDTKFYIGYGVINPSEKHGIFGKKILADLTPKMTLKIGQNQFFGFSSFYPSIKNSDNCFIGFYAQKYII